MVNNVESRENMALALADMVNSYLARHQPMNTKINQYRRKIHTYCTEYGTETVHDAIASGKTIIEAENERAEAEEGYFLELLSDFHHNIDPKCFNNLFIAYFWLRLPDEVKNYIHLNANKLNYIFMVSILCARPVGHNAPIIHTLDIPIGIFNLIPHYSTYSTYSNNLYISPSNEITIRSVSTFGISHTKIDYMYFLDQKDDENEGDFENYCNLIFAIEQYNEYDHKNYDKGFLDLISQI